MAAPKKEAPKRGRPPKAPVEVIQVASEGIERPSMRPAMRDESPRARADRRAAELRGHLGSLDEGTDEFYFDISNVPDGWSYEWKRRMVMNQEDSAYTVSLRRMGWEPVPASRHPEMMPTGTDSFTIERKGMVLMERPSEITDEAKSIELRKARNQVNNKKEQLGHAPDGQFGRAHESVRPKVTNSYSPIPIPGD